MQLLADVNISNEALGVVGIVVGTLWSALLLMWKEQRAQGEREKADLRRQRDDLLRLVVRSDLEDEIPASIPHSAIPPREPPRT